MERGNEELEKKLAAVIRSKRQVLNALKKQFKRTCALDSANAATQQANAISAMETDIFKLETDLAGREVWRKNKQESEHGNN
ncbi:MAG: hypothetical protein JSS83_14355 [Cyanobacteria bacterium SZAS LIN-3]|nr:hypothetical protein [Cyanobacteria bacterium SZAS LIN-3]